MGVARLGGASHSPRALLSAFDALGTLVQLEGVVTSRAELPWLCAPRRPPRGARNRGSRSPPRRRLCHDFHAHVAMLRELPEAAPPGEAPSAAVLVVLPDELTAPLGERVHIVGTLKAVVTSHRSAVTCRLAVVATSVAALPPPAAPAPDAATAERIHQLAATPPAALLAALAGALAPELGDSHMDARRALVLLLAGGCGKERPGFRIRGDVHCLLASGPPAARAALLHAVAAAAAHAVSAQVSTSCDHFLSCALRRDADLGCWALYAGSLVLASGGVACIDALEAVGPEAIALYEVLEAQSVTVARPGASAETMRARCAVLAAAAPPGGAAYDPSRSVAENLGLLDSLLSCLDLAFVLRDEAGPAPGAPASADGAADAPPPLDAAFLKAFVGVARTHTPRLTSEAVFEHIAAQYAAMRAAAAAQPPAGPPTNVRALSTLIRLAEAHARLRLSAEVVPADADAALEVMRAAADSGGGWAGPS